MFYRTVALSENMVVNYTANTMTFVYRSTMTNHELLYMPMSAIKYKYKEMWKINVNATYYDYVNIFVN